MANLFRMIKRAAVWGSIRLFVAPAKGWLWGLTHYDGPRFKADRFTIEAKHVGIFRFVSWPVIHTIRARSVCVSPTLLPMVRATCGLRRHRGPSLGWCHAGVYIGL